MCRTLLAIALALCLNTDVPAATLDGTITGVSKTGFVIQTAKGPKSIKFGEHQLKGVTSWRGKGFDALYRLKPDDVKEGMEVCVEYRVAGTDWVCDGIRPYSARIDFGQLAKADGKYTLHLKLV